MNWNDVLTLLLVAGSCAGVCEASGGRTRGGYLLSFLVGLLGALVGVLFANLIDLPEVPMLQIRDVDFPVVWAIMGSALAVLVISGWQHGPADF